jgi:hypothetical protein
MDTMQALEMRLSSRQSGKVTKIRSRQSIAQHLLTTFDVLGGVDRLTHWANQNDENYGEFLKLWIKALPREELKEVGQVIEYRSNVPGSPLNHFEPVLEVIEDGMQREEEEGQGQGQVENA